MNTTALAERDLRQRDLIPPQRLARCGVTVIGVGAIGRPVALQLAAMGVGTLHLIDFDIVEPVNLAPQGYHEADLGRLKVDATAELCRRCNGAVDIQTHATRFRRRMDIGDTVMCCVDSIDTRRLIWEAVADRVDLFVDGRMAAEVVRVLAASDDLSRSHYPTTLFDSSQAYAQPCTARATIYCASVAAGLMVGQLSRHLRGLPVEPDLTVNLLAGEWSAIAPAA